MTDSLKHTPACELDRDNRSAPSEAAMREAWEIWDANDSTPEALVDRIARALDRHAAAGWKEAIVAWSICASIHREYAKGKDPFYMTRQSDFIQHEEAARAKIAAAIRSAT